jgi:hypothetical protein
MTIDKLIITIVNNFVIIICLNESDFAHKFVFWNMWSVSILGWENWCNYPTHAKICSMFEWCHYMAHNTNLIVQALNLFLLVSKIEGPPCWWV